MAEVIRDGTGNSFDARVDRDNRLYVSNSDGLEISKGNISGVSYIHKFGKAPDFDISDGYVTVWDGANDGTVNAMNYVYSTTADIDSIVSSDAGDVQSIEIQGLDNDGILLTQNLLLNGQSRVNIGSAFWRVFRMKNTGSSDFTGNISCYTSGTITAGVVDDSDLLKAHINNANNQTLMAVYTIPSGTTGYMKSGFVSAAGAIRSSTHNTRLFTRPLNGVFQLKHDTTITTDGTSHIQHFFEIPGKIPALTDLEVKTNTDVNVAGVSAGFEIVLIDN